MVVLLKKCHCETATTVVLGAVGNIVLATLAVHGCCIMPLRQSVADELVATDSNHATEDMHSALCYGPASPLQNIHLPHQNNHAMYSELPPSAHSASIRSGTANASIGLPHDPHCRQCSPASSPHASRPSPRACPSAQSPSWASSPQPPTQPTEQRLRCNARPRWPRATC